MPYPHPQDIEHLRPDNRMAVFYVLVCSALTATGAVLSLSPGIASWAVGQGLLALALSQWFIVLHEAGHMTLFRQRRANMLIGHVAAFCALIPFANWRIVHARHHKWTGWQDKDITTADLVPRPLGRVERVLINVAWRTSFPLFSVLYRLNNYWLLPRLRKYYPTGAQLRKLRWGVVLLSCQYIAFVWLVGPPVALRLCGLALFGAMLLQDPFILSQHTHIPAHLSAGNRVRPFSPAQQQTFTRSLLFPGWFSRIFLMGFDAHELHHMYVRVPGYFLRHIEYMPDNQVHWWQWLRSAKKLRGEMFLFGDRKQSGFSL